tara:strand:+ start:956 stop:1435 length:480 start_codon:yes stop_codon:yes gene_type:complete
MLNAADCAGVVLSVFIRNAITMAIRRGGEHRFSEIAVSPRSGSSVDKMMEWLCSRAPSASDFISASGELQPRVKKALYSELPPTQARRFEMVLRGLKMEVIGYEEGCSRQAVHASIKRAVLTLKQSQRFAKALCEAMPDSGLTPDILLEAVGDGKERQG